MRICHSLSISLIVTAVMSPSLLADGDAGDLVLYQLGEGSTFQEGCFEPCMCPILEPVPMVGTFELIGTPTGMPVEIFGVANVAWQVPSLDLSITGAGTYTIHAEFVSFHQLELDLQIGDEPPVHFDSGFILGGLEFPEIGITVTMNNMYCYDMVFTIVASPVEPADTNGDGVVDVLDLLAVLGNWGSCPPQPDCPCDTNDDGLVNVIDLLAVLAAW